MLNFSKDQYGLKRSTGLFLVNLLVVLIFIFGFTLKKLFFTYYPIIYVEFDESQCVIENGFDLKWLHSVEKQWWIESYQIEDERLLLTDAYLQTFGAGTPSTEAVSEASTKYPDYIHYKMDRSLPYLNWMISPNIKAQLIIDQAYLPIYKWVDGYTNIYIFVKQQNLWALLRQESCYEYNPASS